MDHRGSGAYELPAKSSRNGIRELYGELQITDALCWII
jgi:hypothetical protein